MVLTLPSVAKKSQLLLGHGLAKAKPREIQTKRFGDLGKVATTKDIYFFSLPVKSLLLVDSAP